MRDATSDRRSSWICTEPTGETGSPFSWKFTVIAPNGPMHLRFAIRGTDDGIVSGQEFGLVVYGSLVRENR